MTTTAQGGGWRAILLIPSLLVAGATPARAADLRVALDISGCAASVETGIRRIVRVELGDLLIDANAPAGAANRLTVRCESGRGSIAAEGFDGGRRADRALELGDFPGDAAPRALALAAIEVLAALSPAVRQRLQARQTAARPPEPAKQIAAEPQTAPTRIGLSAGLRSFLAPHGLHAWGARVDLDRRLGGPWSLGFDLDAGAATRDVSLGQTSALLFSAGTFLGVQRGGSRLGGILALGLRAGVVRLAGDSGAAPGVVAGSAMQPWGGPAISGRVFAGDRWTFTGSAEVGFAAIGAEGVVEGTTALAASGFWLAAFVGFGIRS